MSWAALLILAIGLLLVILFSGARIFVGFLLLNILGVLVLIGPRGFGMFSNSIFETATSSTLVTVALFVLMGEILFRSGTVDVLFSSIDRLIGRLRGRLYVVTIALSTVFGALSGSAVAVAAMLGRSVLPLMAARGYASRTSATTILAGASLAPIIPPSLLAIIVGSLADASIAGLLVAGIIPGLLFATLTLAWVYLRGGPMPEADITQAETPVWRAVLAMAPFLIVVFSVMGLILLGVASPSESAATGVVGAMVVAAIFGRLDWIMLREAVASAVTISVVILIIVASAKLFSQLLSFTGATRGLVTLIAELGWSPAMTFLLMMAIPFLLCMFIDQIAFMLLAIPIYQPIVAAMGFDPIWFWTIFLINLTVGSLTPPFGYTLFALKGAADGMSTAQVFRAAWPVVGIFLTGLAILWAVPDLVTAIPRALQ
ncbi:TRAP transporter large permease [Rhodophyticola porphyridii]|uniref:TRAP transporter large permease n=1 Tax=Rhodophyticola porphyridii TaxID=1852017 RepID=A0A3L9XY55_9RHOB|nr:TRAP transporter large permease [Rhodophyticola porphyridii]RMA41444.1 TRAP transporter large permease [Rhodophyticola porphyridii]